METATVLVIPLRGILQYISTISVPFSIDLIGPQGHLHPAGNPLLYETRKMLAFALKQRCIRGSNQRSVDIAGNTRVGCRLQCQ
jgi:hypothetical protein